MFYHGNIIRARISVNSIKYKDMFCLYTMVDYIIISKYEALKIYQLFNFVRAWCSIQIGQLYVYVHLNRIERQRSKST